MADDASHTPLEQTFPSASPDAVHDLFLNSDSSSDLSPASMVFSSSMDDCFPMQMTNSWPLSMQQPLKLSEPNEIAGIGNLGTQDDYYLEAGTMIVGERHPSTAEPKKARRQAQNRAAQRAFRERKEKYIQELEGKTAIMSKRIKSLESDRKRLEGALRVARVEVDALKSFPSRVSACSTAHMEKNKIACTIEIPGGRHAVILTLDLGVQETRSCKPEVDKSTTKLEGDRTTDDDAEQL